MFLGGKKMKKVLYAALIGLMLVGCSSNNASPEKNKLTVGVMPSLDSAPIILANEAGYFDDLGLELELHVYNNAKDRDSEIETGVVDGVIDDLLGLMTKTEAGFKLKATSTTDGIFHFVSNNNENALLRVGLMEMSVTNYLSDYHFKGQAVEKVFINAIPQRMEMVISGQLDRAVLPEPVASQGVLGGLEKIQIDAPSTAVLMFTQDAIDQKTAAIESFYDAYNKAVEDINADDTKIRSLVVKTFNLNEAIVNVMTIPTYKKAYVVEETTYEDVKNWITSTLEADINQSYHDVFDLQFIQ